MKLIILSFAIITILLTFDQCTSQKKIQYDLPEAMAPNIKADYLKQCEKGRILYEINCAGCHTKKVNGKRIIPDFKPEQLVGYELRISNPSHESGIPETNVSAEELGLIMTFLSYKRKNTPVKN